jgi:uracil-DNA glycosylase
MALPTFPFGAPVLPRSPSASEPRRVYLLGAYPSGLHVRWTAPAVPTVERRTVRALLVDNEPTPFWDGSRQDKWMAEWKDRVGWQSEWGDVAAPPRGVNGPSGAWVDRNILEPLNLSRTDVCISDCLDTARLNSAQEARVQDTYEPVAVARGLPSCTVRPVPDGERGIVREACEAHVGRLRDEIAACSPSIVITLGNAALRVFSSLAERETPSALVEKGYGTPISARVDGRELAWLPLVHPRSGERTPPWPAVHRSWVERHPPLP